MSDETTLLQRDPFADGTTDDPILEIRTYDGTRNNLTPERIAYGASGQPFLRRFPPEYEDGEAAPAGVGNRQPIPIYTQEEVDRLTALGRTVVPNTDPAINAPFLELDPPDRPSPRVISNLLADQDGESIPNRRYTTDLTWSFGQFVNHDLDLALEGFGETDSNRDLSFPIDIPLDDPDFGENTPGARPNNQFPFERDALAPGTGVNDIPGTGVNRITGWLDLSTVYGSNVEIARELRSFSGGQLRVTPTETGDLLPVNSPSPTQEGKPISLPGAFEGVGFAAGDERVSENNSLAAQHTLWLRNHNRLAAELGELHPDWTDEQLFQRARQLNIAQYQNVVLNQWLPTLLGENNPNSLRPYTGYDDSLNPQTSNAFVTASFRIGHTLVSPTIWRLDENGEVDSRGNISFFRNFDAPDVREGSDLDVIFRGLTSKLSQDVDTRVADDLRNALPNFIGAIPIPLGAVGFDLVSANLQRGRDRGVADYNQLRRTLAEQYPELGIRPVTSFAEITSDPELHAALESVYGTVEDIDPWIGLLIEDPVPGSSFGPTQGAIFREQFERIRNADRFWFDRTLEEGGFFTAEELAAIRDTSFSDILQRNTDIEEIQDNPFFLMKVGKSDPEAMNGGVGADSILGMAGDDEMYAAAGDDAIAGNQGNDVLEGELGNDVLMGGKAFDRLSGGEGNDRLNGDGDSDTLIGGAGSDTFEFGRDGVRFSELGIDEITDFVSGEDAIALSAESFVLPYSDGTISVETVEENADRSEAAIVFDRTTGTLFYNPDGPDIGFDFGGQFATLQPGLTLSEADFRVV
ncbi:peroxidase family protein [Baaleninema sp.]|uniref:peroxidase family protein n=1 Tax=Baaleninema sp. TaxID=3101197 RepID=UPI003D011A0E